MVDKINQNRLSFLIWELRTRERLISEIRRNYKIRYHYCSGVKLQNENNYRKKHKHNEDGRERSINTPLAPASGKITGDSKQNILWES